MQSLPKIVGLIRIVFFGSHPRCPIVSSPATACKSSFAGARCVQTQFIASHRGRFSNQHPASPAQSGFSGLHGLSAGKVFVFQFRPCSAPLGIRRCNVAACPSGIRHRAKGLQTLHQHQSIAQWQQYVAYARVGLSFTIKLNNALCICIGMLFRVKHLAIPQHIVG